LITLPSEPDLAMSMLPADPAAIHQAREGLRASLAGALGQTLSTLHDQLAFDGPFSPDAAGAGRRALRNAALDLLTAQPNPGVTARAQDHYRSASNMTEAMGGLNALLNLGGEALEAALADFYSRWQDEPLVIDKWFALQARNPATDALQRVKALTAHPAFDAKNPNRLRALIQTFASANPARFHAVDGAAYSFLADQILAVDGFNPMTAARLIEPLGSWQRYEAELGTMMKAQLERIKAHPGLSKNVTELAGKAVV
jgi:aminopeptidase N